MKMSINPQITGIIILAVTIAVFSQTTDSIASVTIDTLPQVAVADSSAKPLQSGNSSKITTSETDTKKNVDTMAIPLLKPLAFDTTGRGALHIKVYPSNASIFLNSKHAGNGNRTVKNLQTGIYSLDLVYENDTLSDLIKIEHNKTTELDVSVGKSTQFSIETSFGMLTFNKRINFGPAADLGIQYRNNYFGIDYYWGFGDFYTFGGAALKYRYAVYNSKTIKIAPEIAAGFWYAQNESYYYDYYGYHEQYEDGLFFGGPGCSFKFGYKWVFFNVESIFLIGNNFSHLLKTGFCVFF
jgi:PEGA domain